jgi:tetratricopeptide (TPR) repeat protein
MEELLERYEAYGDESVYAEARRLYEQALAGGGGARVLTEFGYLQECHGRRSIRAAVDCYERAIDADPQYDKPHWQLIYAMAALGQADKAIDRYRQRLTAAPADPRAHRFLASAYLHARDYDHAEQVIHAGLELAPDDPSLTEQQGDLFAATGRPDDPSPAGSAPSASARTTSARVTARRSSWSARTAWPRPPPNGGLSSAGARNTGTPSRRTGRGASSSALRPDWQAADVPRPARTTRPGHRERTYRAHHAPARLPRARARPPSQATPRTPDTPA